MLTKKIENFWYYHKVTVVVISLLVFFLIISLNFNNNPYNDLEISYVLENQVISWEGMQEVKEIFESLLQKSISDIANVKFIPLEGGLIDYQFAIPVAHILFIDDTTLLKYIDVDYFEPLDYYVDKYNIDISNYPEIKIDSKDVDGKIYALPLKELKFLIGYGFPDDNYYFAIRLPDANNANDVKGNKNAHTILKYILDNS